MNRTPDPGTRSIAGTAARMASAAAGVLADCVFPRACPVCGDPLRSDEGLIHRPCMDRLSFIKTPVCTRCGRQMLTSGDGLCHDCTANGRHFIRNFPALNYDETSRRITSDLKYRNRRQNAQFLGILMAYRNKDEIVGVNADCIVPVPISEERRRERRYNQAQLIADALGTELSIPVHPQILIRKKSTKAMKDLGAADRLAEMKNAIAVGEIPDSVHRVLIADDIYTTGATMEACACALAAAGIESYGVSACIGSDY